jgi:hypothetical protein
MTMTAEGIVRALVSAEERLGMDLMLCLWGDGSGRVVDPTTNIDLRTNDVFLFEHVADLEDWLREPRRVSYDATGKPVAKAGA